MEQNRLRHRFIGGTEIAARYTAGDFSFAAYDALPSAWISAQRDKQGET